jgi:pimeloyl-ACP methyl ester carboxylesterase
MLLAHGILGAGANWRGIAKKVVERRPDWAIELVDLRQHGQSEPGEPPHDLAACAGDLHALADELGGVAAIGGHSFGGKVALAARALVRVEQVWIFDASPSSRPDRAADPTETVARLLAFVERAPRTWERRDDFVAAVVADGHARPLAQWFAMNLVPAGGGYALRLDVDAIRELLADYYVRDLWSVLLDPALPGTVELVIAARSNVVDDDDRRRLATAPPHVHVTTIDAGHWLHIDAPDAVVDLVARRLPGDG